MFGSKEKHSGHGLTTLIARNTRVEGTVKYSGELNIEGIVEGDIYAEEGSSSVVKILENGRVDGEVRAPEVIINGHVSGDVYTTGQLYLADKAVVDGNVNYNTIEMEKGAQINGKLVHIEEMPIKAESPLATESVEKESSSGKEKAEKKQADAKGILAT